MSALKRLKVDEHVEPINWRNPRFSDWKLTWRRDSGEAKSWDVHRCVLIGGARPATFFAGAAREGAYATCGTDLSVLLPEACMEHMDQVLDFIYGEPLGQVTPQVLMPLLKIADVLQCPKLQNLLLDLIEEHGLHQHGTMEVLLKDACNLELYTVAESLVSILPLSRLTTMDFDLLENCNSAALMRTVARRMANVKMVQWGLFVGHGQVNADGSISIALPNSPMEKSRKGYWCLGTGIGEVLVGNHTWKLRIDHVPHEGVEGWNMIFGVVSGAPPAVSSTTYPRYCFHTYFKAGAALDLGLPAPWNIGVAKGNEDWGKVRDAIQPPIHKQRARRGDIVYVSLKLYDGKSDGDIEWRLNGDVVSSLRGQLAPAAYRLCVELQKHDYEAESMGITLLAHEHE